jgi:hypothetical protein
MDAVAFATTAMDESSPSMAMSTSPLRLAGTVTEKAVGKAIGAFCAVAGKNNVSLVPPFETFTLSLTIPATAEGLVTLTSTPCSVT